MNVKRGYAIVDSRTEAPVLFDERMAIYWTKKVAVREAEERGLRYPVFYIARVEVHDPH